MKEVKFYSVNDIAVGWNLKKVGEIYIQFQIESSYTLNQIIELYNCTKYIENRLYLDNWDKAQINEVNKTVKGFIARYFSELKDVQILEELKDLQFNFKEDFLDLFFKYKLEIRVSEEYLRNWIDEKIFSIYTICHNKRFVEFYNDITRDLLLENPSNAELIIDKFLNESSKEKHIYLPSYSDAELNNIIDEYIDSLEVNLNYVDLIVTARSTKGFIITGELKLKAKRKAEKLREQYFKTQGGGIQFEHMVAFKRDLEAPMTADINGKEGQFRIYFDKNWLEEELDYFTILYNFIWLFSYLDSNGRISMVNLQSEASALENAIGITGRYDYKTNHTFGSKEMFSQMKFNLYYELLMSKEVELERVLEWYFNVYVKEEYSVDNYIVELPSKYATYKEKCLAIFAEIEYVLVQFDAYVKYKNIDQELIEMNSHSILFSQVPSLVDSKYIYAKRELNYIMFQLFSDQASLNYIDEHLKGNCFFELINFNKLKVEQFHNYQRGKLQQLIELNYIIQDPMGFIKWNNPNKIALLHNLYKNEVIIYQRLSKQIQIEIDQLIREGLVETECKLFSKLEQNYFDYYLNNHQFQNGLQLRNKYMHRRQVLLDDEQHKQNYLIGLRLLICIVLKINEEFCIAEDNNTKESMN
ncbi:hypothetical protein [Solibacillus sp. FSL K6-1523]|uniref:hypothetical protein n=1 Tax=Solibacillus sp. FSL K6-1523 TaxID=2921471 RepID=UPI0030F71CA6